MKILELKNMTKILDDKHNSRLQMIGEKNQWTSGYLNEIV